jgi:hypothetical protein
MSRSAPPAAASSLRTGDGGLHSFVGSAEGGLPDPKAIALAPDEDLLGPGTAGFAAGGGLLPMGAVDFGGGGGGGVPWGGVYFPPPPPPPPSSPHN